MAYPYFLCSARLVVVVIYKYPCLIFLELCGWRRGVRHKPTLNEGQRELAESANIRPLRQPNGAS